MQYTLVMPHVGLGTLHNGFIATCLCWRKHIPKEQNLSRTGEKTSCLVKWWSYCLDPVEGKREHLAASNLERLMKVVWSIGNPKTLFERTGVHVIGLPSCLQYCLLVFPCVLVVLLKARGKYSNQKTLTSVQRRCFGLHLFIHSLGQSLWQRLQIAHQNPCSPKISGETASSLAGRWGHVPEFQLTECE